MAILRSIIKLTPYIIAYFLFVQFNLIWAHGELDSRIQHVSEQIEQQPNFDSLYIVRGTLYFQHEEYLKSIRDFEKVESLSGPSVVVHMSYAKAWRRLSEYDFAIENVNDALAMSPNNAVAHRLRGNILVDQRKFAEAADEFEMVLNKSGKRITEHYTEYISALDSISTSASGERAITVLQRGIDDLGKLPLFTRAIVNQHVKLNDYPNAISIQTTLIKESNRKERHLLKRAQLYSEINEFEKSLQDIVAAHKEIDALPQRYAHSEPMKSLKFELDALYKKLDLK